MWPTLTHTFVNILAYNVNTFAYKVKLKDSREMAIRNSYFFTSGAKFQILARIF